jgi:hypothetical protein
MQVNLMLPCNPTNVMRNEQHGGGDQQEGKCGGRIDDA